MFNATLSRKTKILAVTLMAATALVACSPSSRLGKDAQGAWRGWAQRAKDNGTVIAYEVLVIVHNDKKVLIDYPDTNCGGELVMLPGREQQVQFQEKITYGQDDDCPAGAHVTMSLVAKDHTQMKWNWALDTKEGNKTVKAQATLYRIPPKEPQDVLFYRNQRNMLIEDTITVK